MNFELKPCIILKHEGFNIYVYDCETNVYFYVEDEIIGHFNTNIYNIHEESINEKNLNLKMFDNKQYIIDYLIHFLNYYNGRLWLDAKSLAYLYGLDMAIKIEKTFNKTLHEYKNKYEYSNNFRIAEIGNIEQEKLYSERASKGCCGFYDKIIEVDNKQFKVGFNFGH